MERSDRRIEVGEQDVGRWYRMDGGEVEDGWIDLFIRSPKSPSQYCNNAIEQNRTEQYLM